LVARQYYWKAFKEYQQLIEKHPNTPYFDAVLQREFEIANLFAAGERQRVWGVRFFPTPEKAIEIYNQIVKNGPYSAIAPESQLRIGLVYEKQKDYLSAVHAYEKLLERYPNDPHAEAAQFQIGYAYKQESARAEYDQDLANKSIAAFQDFLVRFPNSDKVPAANEYLASMKAEQSKGLFLVAKFYEKRKNYKAALIYYNEVIAQNPQSDWANQAKEKVAKLAPQIPEPTANP
jgi:outer membrane protein assembly factor BamD